jgi:predicted permease
VTGARVVVLGYAFWRSRFGGDVSAVGQTLRIKGQPYEIVGVAPRGFRGIELADVDLWLPLFARGDGTGRPVTWHTSAGSRNVRVVARLDTDHTVEQASSQLTALQRQFLEDTYPVRDPAELDRMRRSRAVLGPIAGGLGDDLRPVPEVRVTVWLVGVAFVLVAVACSNVAGLLLLRAMRRRREIAVRLALGVTRARLTRQLLTESSVLALIGGLAALVTVVWAGAWLQRTILPAMAWERSALVEPGVVLVVALSTLATALIAGMAPLSYARSDVLPALRDGALGTSSKRPRMQAVLLAAQGVLSIVLLVGAGLFLRSLQNAETMNVGFDRDEVLAVQLDFSGTGRSDRDVAAFFERALDRVSSVPGVTQASLSFNIPLRSARAGSFRLPGHDDRILGPGGRSPYVNYVTPGFFRTTGMRILEGRGFVDSERSGAPVIVVSETMARRAWPDRSPVGACVYMAQGETCTTVVGVVADAIIFDIVDEEPNPYFYAPLTADPSDRRALLVRQAPGVGRIDGAIRQALQELDAGLPFVRIATLGEALNPQIRPWRLGAAVFTAFGLLAMALAMVGLWSSVSYAVSQRTNEFAIRLAIGAGRASLVKLVLGDGVRTAAVAIGAGLLIAAAASGFIADLLFEVSPRDPVVFGTIAGAVLAVATMASLLPAWRATRIQPVEALRAE